MSDSLNRRQAIRLAAASLAGGVAIASGAVQARPASEVKKWDHEVDAVVVGLGVAGGAAAYEAAKAGLKVVVMDRGSAAINESHGNDIYLGGGTPTQKAYGVEDTLEEMEKFLLATQAPEPDRERIKYYVEHSLSHYQWLKSIGIEFSLDPSGHQQLIYSGGEDVYPCTEMAKPAMRGHMHVSMPSGMAIQSLLTSHLRKADVPLLLEADAQQLVREADGRIVGVIAVVEGKTQSFRAKRGVIIATGGFSRNREMVAHHAPLYQKAIPIEVKSNDGWGIRAGQSIGAAVKRMDGIPCFFPLPRFAGALVNSNGQRFIAEESYYGVLGYRIVREQGGVAHLIVDADMVGKDAPESRGNGEIDSKIIAKADTLAELEKMLNIPETGLQQTIATYNEFAAKGQDPFFHKAKAYLKPIVKPPFYAAKASIGETTFAHYTLGGLHTNANTEVLDPEGETIPGLYAVGRAAAGILNYRYYLSGLSLGEGTMFGRVAGQALAKQK